MLVARISKKIRKRSRRRGALFIFLNSMAAPPQQFDDMLMSLAQHHADIPSLLRTFFGFLHRKTDFYVEMTHPGEKMGFPRGAAEKMVVEAFHQFEMKQQQFTSTPPSTRQNDGESHARETKAKSSTAVEQTPAIQYTDDGKQSTFLIIFTVLYRSLTIYIVWYSTNR